GSRAPFSSPGTNCQGNPQFIAFRVANFSILQEALELLGKRSLLQRGIRMRACFRERGNHGHKYDFDQAVNQR
ncbi:MAG: hypothetical protein WCE51_16015, partial [Chthoniobacterales bacterium]